VHPVVAVGLALASAVCYAASAALQHHEASRQSASGLALVRALARRPRWCMAVGASLLGALLHLGALGAGPLVLVQPIGVTALVFALPVGARLNRARVGGRSWAGAACVAVGLPGVLGLVPHHPAAPGPGVLSYPTAALVVGVLVVAAATAGVLCGRRRPRAGAVLFAVGAALCFGLASAVVRALWLDRAGPSAVVAGLVAMGCGVVLAQHAYRSGGLGAPLAVLNLVDPLTAAGIGVLVLGEALVADPLRLAVGAVGVAVTAVGVSLLSSAAAHAHAPADHGVPVEPLGPARTP
jgi:drug/metabolite transporter (DMT)-like permease